MQAPERPVSTTIIAYFIRLYTIYFCKTEVIMRGDFHEKYTHYAPFLI